MLAVVPLYNNKHQRKDLWLNVTPSLFMLPVPKSSLKWLVTSLVHVTKRKILNIEKLKKFLQSPLVNFL